MVELGGGTMDSLLPVALASPPATASVVPFWKGNSSSLYLLMSRNLMLSTCGDCVGEGLFGLKG
jgi:hypothetical protein